MAKVLSVYLPRWPVQLAMRERQPARIGASRPDADRSAGSALAALLVTCERGKQMIACACEQAEAKGVHPGMSLAHAKALLSGTCVWERPFTPAEDAQRLRRLARWAQRFSPVVAADEPDGLLLDLAGCERLFGSDEQAVARIDAALGPLGLRTRLALAPTVGCAWAVARFAANRIRIVPPERIREALASLPIAGLRLDPAFVGALSEVGIERIGELFDLPREELACRFGADLLRRLDQATGQVVETISPVRVSTPIVAARAFEVAVTSLEAVVMTLRELLFSLVLQLEERECGVRTLDVVFDRMAAEPCRLAITLTHPSRDVRHLWTLLRPRIERVNLGYGVESVSLRVSRFASLPPRQLCFHNAGQANEDPADEAAFGEFLDRLIDRLGRQAVCAMAAVATHVPEEAFPLQALATAGERPDNAKESSPPRRIVASSPSPSLTRSVKGGFVALPELDRPSQLFEVPEPAQVICLVPDGPPSWMRWRGRACAVRCDPGLERLALPWWEAKRGARPSSDVVRDYYQVQDDRGRHLWVFRDRATNEWFVHGLWA